MKRFFITSVTWVFQKESENVRRRLITGGFWSILGVGISQVFTLVAHAILARQLGPLRYGELGLILNTISVIGGLAGLGLGLTATKYLAELRISDPIRSGRILSMTYTIAVSMSMVFSILVVLFAPFIAREFLNAPHQDVALRIGAMMLFFKAIDGMQMGALAGFEAFYSITIAKFIFGITIVPTALVGTRLFGLEGAILGFALASAGGCFVNYIFLRRECQKYGVKPKWTLNRSEARIFWTFSIPAAMSGFMVTPVTWFANAIIAHQENGYTQLGLFYAAWQWRVAIMFLPGALNNVLLALLSQQVDEGSERLQGFNIYISWIIGLVFAVPLLVFPEAVSWIYGDKYNPEQFGRVISLVMLSTIIMAYKDGLARVLASRSLMWWGVLSNTLWAGILIGSLLILKSRTAVDLGLAYLLAYGGNTLVFVPFYIRRELVPNATIVSWQVFTIWASLIFLMVLVVLGAPFWARGIALTTFVAVTAILFVDLLDLRKSLRSLFA